MALDIPPVREILSHRFQVNSTLCPLCNQCTESATHLILRYQQVKCLWFMSPWSLRIDNLNLANCTDFLQFMLADHGNGKDLRLLLYASLLLEAILRGRN
ncbi:hypothetical protein PanWU01x14_134410 [Parasponia andersonii]|uniref:Reverse transcriptase zinc-binding domain-containing protein n=1 Tax=Parasponia andersonii TaxID=3476 RepID=A0A2P5CPL6_PARAD|nr:hypothetical protein PanWU01x14_134410 [Parasponia andersonii]